MDTIINSIANTKLVDGSMPDYANYFWTKCSVLMNRSSVNSRRLPEIFLSQLVAIISTDVMYASLFWKLESSSGGVREQLGLSASMSTMLYICVNALPVLVEERYIFFRETSHNAYRCSSYVVSRAIAGLPSLVVYSIVFAGLTYFSVSLDGVLYYTIYTLATFWSGSGFSNFLLRILNELVYGYAVVMATIRLFFDILWILHQPRPYSALLALVLFSFTDKVPIPRLHTE